MEDTYRICVIAFMFAPLVGGSEVQAEKQARQLQAFGHDVVVVTLRHSKDWKRQEISDGLPIIRVGGIYNRKGWLRLGRLGHLPIDLLMFFTLWRLRNTYDVIHALQFGPTAAVATLVAKLTHKPVIVSIPTTGPSKKLQEAVLMADTLTTLDKSFLTVDFDEAVGGDITYMARTVLAGHAILNFMRTSDAFYQTLSSRSRPYLISHQFRNEQIVQIPNAIDIEKFHPNPEKKPVASQPERVIISVARMQFAKGVDVLLHAWARVMREPADWRAHLKPKLLLAGPGPIQPQLERIASELGIIDSVEFLGLRRDVVDLLQQAWGFVLPSRWEGMPNALLEAMACGLPCVATRVSGSEDIIVDGVNGLMVEPEEPVAMAQALRRVIEDSELAEQLGQQARNTVLRDYQLTTITERYIQLYRQLLSRGKTVLPLTLQEKEEL